MIGRSEQLQLGAHHDPMMLIDADQESIPQAMKTGLQLHEVANMIGASVLAWADVDGILRYRSLRWLQAARGLPGANAT